MVAMAMESYLDIAEFYPETRVLGPGIRAALWVQGCPLKCAGCLAPEWIPFNQGTRISPSALAEKILSLSQIDGLTISGGEPMAQAEGLDQLVRLVRQKRDLHVICFTGYRFERLVRRPPFPGIADFLSHIDILIDGPYVQELNHGDTFAGSRNQRIIKLTSRPLPGDGQWPIRKVELHFRKDEILAVGIPPLTWASFVSDFTRDLGQLSNIQAQKSLSVEALDESSKSLHPNSSVVLLDQEFAR